MEENRKSRPDRRRRLLLVLGAGLALLLLLAVFAPAILSTSWGKGFLESRLSKSLKMPVSLGGCSLGWRSPTQLRGLRAGPSEQGLQCTAANLAASFTVWDWIWHGEELRVEIDRPEIRFRLPTAAEPEPKPAETEVVAAKDDAHPAEAPPEAPLSLPFRKLKLVLREGVLAIENAQGVSATASFDGKASLQAEPFEASLQLDWKQDLAGIASLLPSSGAPISLEGKAEGKLSGAFNRIAGRLSLGFSARQCKANAPSWVAPFEESLLEFSLEEGKINLLLGEWELKGLCLRGESTQTEIKLKAAATDRFREWKVRADLRLLLDRLATWITPHLPAGIPCEGPLEAKIEVELPRRHPERAHGSLVAHGKLDGKDWHVQGSYDGRAEEPSYSLRGSSAPIPVRPAFLSTLAYPIPFLAAKDSHLLRLESTVGGEFSLEGKGLDLPRLRETLRGEGRLSLPGGTFSGPSVLSKILATASKGSLRFESLEAPFRVENGKVTTPGILLQARDTKITMTGTTSFEGAIEYTVRVDLPEKLKEKGWSASLEELFGKEGLPVGLTGTVSDPRASFRMPEWKEAGKVLLEEGLEALKKRRKKD